MIWEIANLLPIDTLNSLRASQPDIEHDRNSSSLCLLREECLEPGIATKEENINQIFSSLDRPKLVSDSERSMTTMGKPEQNMLRGIGSLIKELDGLEEYFLHPS
jgi:uncharacterized protein (UPF0262 family)